MTRSEKWDLLVKALEADIPGFEVSYKTQSKWHRFLGYISVWSWGKADDGSRVYGYMGMTTTVYPKVWFESPDILSNPPLETLEHEWVHLKDAGTMFGLFKKSSRFWAALWNALYLLIPQGLALLALLAIWVHPAFLLCLLCLAPLPAPFRAVAELRAYRRNVETQGTGTARLLLIDRLKPVFYGWSYYVMWPFPKAVERSLMLSSPYQEEMDAVYQESSSS
jgi:hypothetical protein